MGINERMREIEVVLGLEDSNNIEPNTIEDYNDVLLHRLYCVHIKKKNDALSESNPHICIGYSYLGDLSTLTSRDELKSLYMTTSPDNPKRKMGNEVGQIWRFKNEAQIGDYVIFSESNCIHIGRIESNYIYDATDRPEQQDADYKNIRKVKWLKTNIDKSQLSQNFRKSLSTQMSFFTLNDYRSVIADLLRDEYVEDEIIEEIDEDTLPDFDFHSSPITDGQNLIVYGTPGCGKSYYVEHELLKDIQDYERTTFFQDYTYTDFVGQVLPVVEGDRVTYKFNPGPFTRALEKAIKNPNEKVALVIEELNRGSAASIFGDIFQLLDRDENGVSEYEITNVNIADYLNEKFKNDYIKFEAIKIPGNLSIFATMNTSDQNVFVLDNAFKRRWKFKKCKNNFDNHKFKGKFIPGPKDKANYTWEQMVNLINEYILSKGDDTNSEDKQIGVYFVDEKGMRDSPNIESSEEDINDFAYKFLEYIWDDVARFSRSDWFSKDIKSLDQLVEKYKEIGVEVFNESVRNKKQ